MLISILLNSILVLLSFELGKGIIPLTSAEPRVAEIFREDNYYSPIVRKSLSSSHASDERKMILTNSISDDEGEEPSTTVNTKPFNTTQGNSSHVAKQKTPFSASNSKSNSSGNHSATDAPIFNVIPDSEPQKLNSTLLDPVPESEPLSPQPETTSLISDLVKEPQIFMDVIKLKWGRLQQIGTAVLMFAIVLAIKALLTSWGPYLARLPLEGVGHVIAQEAGRQVLGNTIMYAISKMTNTFG